MYDEEDKKVDKKEVNTDTFEENVYYNYEEPVKPPKKNIFKKIFRIGKKKVTKSEDIGVQENFYGDDYQNNIDDNKEKEKEKTTKKKKDKEKKEVKEEKVKETKPFIEENIKKENKKEEVNKEEIKYYEEDKKIDKEDNTNTQINKKAGYMIAFGLLLVAIVIIIINLISKVSSKYEIEVGILSVTLRNGESYQVPFSTNDISKTTFKVDDSTVATVNSNGFIKARSVKSNKEYIETKLTVGSETDKEYKVIKIYVVQTDTNIPLESFEVDSNITINKGKTKLISIKNIKPEMNTQTDKYRYESDNTSIVSVDSTGLIKGISRGNTTIKVYNISNPDLVKTINVTVK